MVTGFGPKVRPVFVSSLMMTSINCANVIVIINPRCAATKGIIIINFSSYLGFFERQFHASAVQFLYMKISAKFYLDLHS